MVKIQSYLNLRRVLAATLLPLVLAGLFVLGVKALGLVRYDPAYFTAEYVEQYDTPGSVARALEGVLQTNDRALLAELQGLRRTAAFEADPKIIFIMLWERDDRYFTYMYQDMQTLRRHPHYVEKVKGRWVVAPADAHYYLHSGRWLVVFTPLALVWWVLEIVVMLGLLVYRLSARLRGEMYGG
jgi:hypothetical protein